MDGRQAPSSSESAELSADDRFMVALARRGNRTIAQLLWALTDVDGSWRLSDDDELVTDAEDCADSLEWGAA